MDKIKKQAIKKTVTSKKEVTPNKSIVVKVEPTPKKTPKKKFKHKVGDNVVFYINFAGIRRNFNGEILQINEFLKEVVLKLPKGNIVKKKFNELK